jgi:hypothetical protein
MKANLQGKIMAFKQDGSEAKIDLIVHGKVNTTNLQAQPIHMSITCSLKQIIADQMKLGDIMYLTITNESSES